MLRRQRFSDVIKRQLDFFEIEHGGLVRDCEAAEEAYNRAPREEAEERYGDYLDLVETAAHLLAELRDGYVLMLDAPTAAEYEVEFNRAVAKRYPRFAVAIEDA